MNLSFSPEIQSSLSPVVSQAVRFTAVYQQHLGDHPAIREAACLRAQFPAVLGEIEPGDGFAGGYRSDKILYTGSIWWAMMPCKSGPSKQGGYCFDFAALEKYGKTDADRAAIQELEAYWDGACTWSRIAETWDADMDAFNRLDGQVVGRGNGWVLAVQIDRLLQFGIPAIREQVRQRHAQAAAAGEEQERLFLQGLLEAINVLETVCDHYETQAREMAHQSTDATERDRLGRIAASLSAIVRRPPESLHEAIQLWWIYNVLTSGRHIEGWQLDVALGDFYANDIDCGRLTEAEALDILADFWRMYGKHGEVCVSRAIIGGRGRRNEAAANRFGMAAMEVTRRLRQVIPQLTLRFYEGQDERLMQKAYDVLGEGCIFPMLYNDDVNIAAVRQALHVTEEDAERYYPLGCGEYMIGGASPSLLNLSWSIPKTIEATLCGGYSLEGERIGAEGPAEFASFEELLKAMDQQIRFSAELSARCALKNNALMASECAFLFGSLLMDDCVARGRSIMDGGVRYMGSCIMGHGFTNAADALVAIRNLVFEEQKYTMEEIVQALRDNFEGHPMVLRDLLAQPKYGNDDDAVDSLLVDLWQRISRATDEAGRAAGLDFMTFSSVNPGGYFLGEACGATADGRKAGEPFAIGNAPVAGRDRCGLTAMLNSVAKVDPVNGGSATNIKLAKNLFSANRPKLEALMQTYWKRGAMQASIAVVDQEDLKAAMERPEEYPHLLVRVGGWTARFIDCDPVMQQEILNRTLY